MGNRQSKEVVTLGRIVEILEAELLGDGSVEISAVNTVSEAQAGEVCFVTAAEHESDLKDSKASGVITAKRIDGLSMSQVLVGDVRQALIKALNIFAPKLEVTEGIHRSAVVEESAKIGSGVSICALSYIGADVEIGDGCIIGAGCKIGEGTVIGENTRLDSNTVVYHDCKIGKNCIIQANSTIGSTGFGYYYISGSHELIPHNGGVIIEDCVEIGANSCVDRAKFGNTIIGAGTKIDNQVQIAHNVVIGKCCLIASQVGIAGSCRLGDGVVFGGQSGMADHITLGDGVIVGARASVIKGFSGPGKQLWGTPARELRAELRQMAALKRVPEMIEQLKELSEKVEKLEAAENDKK